MVLSSTLRVFLRRLYRDVAELAWSALAALLLVHLGTCWAGFLLAGESDMTDAVTFLYFYATTATTVGYGDISPQTDAGRLLAILWLFPGGIALFTTAIAKSISSISEAWRRRMNGLGDYASLVGASVLIGYHPLRTPHMIDEIISGGLHSDIVLVSRKIDTAPDDRARFVRAESLTDEAALIRAGVVNAAHVVVYADDDEQTLAAALAVSALTRTAHLVAFFDNARVARLLKSHCARAECVISTSVEQVVRAMQDPGSSIVIDTLVSSTDAATIYSLVLPRDLAPVPVARLAARMRTAHQANLVAFMPGDGGAPAFHYDDGTCILPGNRFFFVRDRRLSEAEVDWSQLVD